MRSVGIVCDGGFIRKVLHHKRKHPQTANDIYQAILSIKQELQPMAELYRIFFYDGVPDPHCDKVYRNPIDGSRHRILDQLDHKSYLELFSQIKQMPFVAFRYGELSFQGWQVGNLKRLNQKILRGGCIEPDDCFLKVVQKSVDIKMGLDIAHLASKRLVDSLILVAGDSDLIPAMKFARREGLQVFLATLGHPVTPSMQEHSDKILK